MQKIYNRNYRIEQSNILIPNYLLKASKDSGEIYPNYLVFILNEWTPVVFGSCTLCITATLRRVYVPLGFRYTRFLGTEALRSSTIKSPFPIVCPPAAGAIRGFADLA